MHMAQRYRLQAALFECRRIIEADWMDSQSRLGPRERSRRALNLACLPCSFGFFCVHFSGFYRPRAECALMHDTRVFKRLRSEVHKRREILSRISVSKFKI